jgi:hypothetical protein
MKLRLIRAAAAASMVGALTVPAAAHASFVLDTGTPTGASTYALLTSPYDVEFAANPGETITSIAAYLTVGSGQPGDNVLFEIFTAAGISNRNAVPVYSTEATFHANGWTSASASWTPSAAADYWLVVAPVTGQTGLDLPGEASQQTGTVRALGFGVGTGSTYRTSTAAIGVEVSAVPLPPAAWLMLFGLGALGWVTQRKRI